MSNFFSRIVSFAVLALALTALSGCVEDAADMAQRATVDAANMHPADGYWHLVSAYDETIDNGYFTHALFFRREAREAREILAVQAGHLMIRSAENGDIRPLQHALDDYSNIHISDTEIAKAAQVVVTNAGTPDAPAPILFLGAKLLMQGRFVMQDHTLAKDLAERAWLAKHPKAAQLLTELHRQLGSSQNAYLWSVRCIAGCADYSHEQRRVQLQKSLSPEELLRAQALSTDPLVLAM